ncbi:MAG TPA: cyclodeaminase/cyclohydrolase family protein [Gaiellaceae bacterium]|nr:cyclodeaminase/cyclohydrolase family protein [Gaiellaceae bacterium]
MDTGGGRPDFELGPALALLASPQTSAAAGSAAALAGAAAAAVVGKAAAASGRKGEAAQAAALRERLARLAAADSEVLGAARAALSVTGEGESEQRDFALGRVLRHASAVPREIAEACADLAQLAAGEANEVVPDLRADATAAGLLAAGAAAAAAHLVSVNLAVHDGDDDLRRARAAAESARAATI